MNVRKSLIAVRQLFHSLVFGLFNESGRVSAQENLGEYLASRGIRVVYYQLCLKEVADISFVIEPSMILRLIRVFRPVSRYDHNLIRNALVQFLNDFVLNRPLNKIPTIRQNYIRKSLRVEQEWVEKLKINIICFLQAI